MIKYALSCRHKQPTDFFDKMIDKNGAHTAIFRKRKNYILPTNNNLINENNISNADSNILNTTNSILIASETQTQLVEATQDPQVSFVASEAPTEEVANLGDKTANGLEKLQ